MVRVGVLLVVALGLMLALLSLDKEEIASFLAGGAEPAQGPSQGTVQPPQAPVAREVSLQTDLYSFDYTYPAQAAAIPGLRDLLERRMEESRVKLEAEARESRKDARANNYPFQPHYLDLGWQVSADLPGWLGLMAAVQSYGGGAHPNHHFDALVWERRAGRVLDPLDLFVSAEALDAAVHKRYCAALDQERAERREESIAQVREDEMWKCPGVAELTIVLESRGAKAFDHLLLLAAPYVAGPYVEGSYETGLTVDDAVIAAVRPEFREAFRVAR